MTATPGQADYLDVKVIQNMRAGEVINSMITSEEAIDAWDDTAMDSVKSSPNLKAHICLRSKDTVLRYVRNSARLLAPKRKGSYTAIYSHTRKVKSKVNLR